MNNKNSKQVAFNEGIAVYAFRYALGRQTYCVKEVIDYLKEHLMLVEDWQKRRFISEIEWAIETNHYGMEMDKREWLEFKEFIESNYLEKK